MLELVLNAIPAVISAGIIALFATVRNMLKSAEAQRKKGQEDINSRLDYIEALLSQLKHTQYDLLRDRLHYLLRKYLDDGYCPFEDRQIIDNLFCDYEGIFNGNGQVRDAYNRFRDLPYFRPEEN